VPRTTDDGETVIDGRTSRGTGAESADAIAWNKGSALMLLLREPTAVGRRPA
jgi:hypothetical protein